MALMLSSLELADHNDLETNARANAADARQKRQSTEKNKVHHNLYFSKDLLPNKINRETSLGFFLYILHNEPK